MDLWGLFIAVNVKVLYWFVLYTICRRSLLLFLSTGLCIADLINSNKIITVFISSQPDGVRVQYQPREQVHADTVH
jgi:hypothetical protein